MKKQDTVNTFNEGLIMDLNPLVTPNNVLVNCLNGTITTFSGNENVLQNDMGNGRVETAFLPEGYVPLGTTELGGIIYIVSYNPLIDKCQIGSFPSPERNITTDELGESTKTLTVGEFYSDSENNIIGSPYKKLILLDKVLHPGDKFQIYCQDLATKSPDYISAQEAGNSNADLFPRYLKLNVVAVQDDGQINNLNDTLVWNSSNNYYILENKITMNNGKLDLDEYRDLISSNYNVFNSKVDGRLAILAELECIDTFDVSWDAVKDDQGSWNFYFFLNWTYDNDMSKDKINLYNIKVECDKATSSKTLDITDYPSNKGVTRTDIMQNQETVFYTPQYINKIEQPNYSSNDGITLPRKNDGSDNQYLLYQPFVLPKDASGIANFTIYPGMPFGFLDYLKHSFSIDLDKLGTGEIDLKEYRYWYDPNNITINWALEAYPERNKQIDNVKFKFYKFDEQVNAWIKEYGKTLDEDRVVKTKVKESWENSGSLVSQIGVASSFEYTVPQQSSYSGHFTEEIKELEENQLYLVEIEISYNKQEKVIKYYRFLYTSNLFNDYYFDDKIKNDFKNIVLQEALDTCHPISHTTSNVKLVNQNKKESLIGEDGNEVKEGIPENVEEGDVTTKSYTIKSEYSCNLNFDLLSKTDNSIFDISLSNITIQNKGGKDDITINPTNTGQQQMLDSPQAKSTTEGMKGISTTSELKGSFSGENFSGTFKQTLATPFEVNYQRSSKVRIPYSLTPLEVTSSWLMVDGGSKWIDFYLVDSYGPSSNASSNTKNGFGDDSHKCGPLSAYNNVYSSIKNKLRGNDVVALRFRVYQTAKSGNEGNWTVWGTGSWHGGDRAKADYNIYYGTKNQAGNGAALPIYAMLDVNDDVQLFTFAKSYRVQSGTDWYGAKTVISTDSANRWPASVNVPLSFRTDAQASVLEDAFKKYYKLVESEDTRDVRQWSRILYYNNYTWNTSFAIGCTGTMSIKINKQVLAGNSYPNNLYYETSRQFKAEGHISNKENFDKYVDMLIYPASSKVLIKKGDAFIEIENANPKNIYDASGQPIAYIKLDKGAANGELSSLDNSKYKIKCIDEKLRVVVSGVPSSDSLMVIGREEEQNVAVTGIIKL